MRQWNCELRFRDIVPVFAAPNGKGLVGASDEVIAETFSVRVPYIVNTVPIPADHEVILKWNVLADETKGKKGKREKTWMDDLNSSEIKRAKEK